MRIALLILALLLVAVGGLLTYGRFTPIDKRQYDQIKVGMKEADVHRILRGPPGRYLTYTPDGFYHIKSLRTKGTQKKWEGDCGIIFIWVDDHGVVIDHQYEPPPWSPPPR
jgi:hypothetical protein